MVKAKAKSARGKRAETKAATETRPTLESVAAELAALGVDPVDRLRSMVWSQKRAAGLDAVAALKADPLTIYAPKVIDALARATLACRHPSFRPTYRRLFPEDRTLYLADLVVLDDKEAQALILAASAALRTPDDPNLSNAEEEARVTSALVLARKIQAEAERIAEKFKDRRTLAGKPDYLAVAQARQKVAKDAGLSVEAMQLRIRRACELSPYAPWPEIMPRPPKNRRA